MENGILVDFMIIDRDETSNMICIKIIELTFPGKKVTAFTDSAEAVKYILSNYNAAKEEILLLFIELNLQEANKWRVIDEFKTFPEQVKKAVRIYVLSSSGWPEDRVKAASFPWVLGFINKPLSQAKIKKVVEEL